MIVITCIADPRLLAKRRVPRMFYDDADSGSWTESTYRANRERLPEDPAAPAGRGQVSNHGGRQLDGTVSSIEALPAIVAEVGSRIEVPLDGGIIVPGAYPA